MKDIVKIIIILLVIFMIFKNNKVEKFGKKCNKKCIKKIKKCIKKNYKGKCDFNKNLVMNKCDIPSNLGKKRMNGLKTYFLRICKKKKKKTRKKKNNVVEIKNGYYNIGSDKETILNINDLKKNKQFKNKTSLEIALMIMNSKIEYEFNNKKITGYPRESKYGTLPYNNLSWVNFKITTDYITKGVNGWEKGNIKIFLNGNDIKIREVTRCGEGEIESGKKCISDSDDTE